MAAYNFLQVTEIASYTFVVFNSLLLETDSLPVLEGGKTAHNKNDKREVEGTSTEGRKN